MKIVSVLLLLTIAFGLNLQAESTPRPKYLQGVGIDQNLNAQVPLDAQFKDEFGRPVMLGKYLTRRPVVLALVYYTCPALCDQILHGLVASIRPLRFVPGRDFDVVAISINPAEHSPEAAEKRLNVVNMYSRGGSLEGWHFLTGTEPNIRAVADAVGFHYRYDPTSKMFFHGAGIMVLTPQGKVARYLYGVGYEPKDVKLALVEASHNRIGSPVDQILLFCCKYDATTGKYTLAVLNLLRVGAAVFLALLVAGLAFAFRHDALRYAAHQAQVPEASSHELP